MFDNVSYLAKRTCLLFVFFLSSTSGFAQVYAQAEYDVGVLALRGHAHAQESWKPTIDWLNENQSEYQFNLHTYDFDQLDEAFRLGWLDFILTSPGQATKIAREFPISWLATQKTAFSDIPNRSIASVVVVRQDSPFKDLQQIDGAKIAAVSEKAFGGFLALRYEIDKLGYFHADFFENITFTGPPTDQIILDMVDKNSDVAIVPACTLENLVKEGKIEYQQVRVLNEQRPGNSTCLVSTPLYPNWTFAMTERAPVEVGQYVAQTLFAMPSDHPATKAAQNVGWMLPVPSIQVDNVYKHLDLHPLQKPFGQKVIEWFYEHYIYSVFVLMAFFGLTFYHMWLEWRFQHGKKQLSLTLNELRQKSSLLEHAQRVTIVGELGSSIAHELNQPLAAIKNYSQGAKIRLRNGMSEEELDSVLTKIQQQVSSANDIIQRLRGLINKQPVEKRHVNLPHLIEESIKLVEYDFSRKNIAISFIQNGVPQSMFADATGIQQLLLNVFSNAKDACLAHKGADFQLEVQITVNYYSDRVHIEITDNGIGFVPSSTPLEQAFYTTKVDGLGLGLAICRDVIEFHDGKITLTPLEPIGCSVSIELPYSESPHE